MLNNQPVTPKRHHYNRFAYLLVPSDNQSKQTVPKSFHFLSLNPCSQNPCKSKDLQSQIKQPDPPIRPTQPQTRKPLKYELQSLKKDLFRQQKEQFLNSFIVHTPQKSQIKDEFSIYNDVSTIEYTKSNQTHTHRNFFESIFQQEFDTNPVSSSQSFIQKRVNLRKVQTQSQQTLGVNTCKKVFKNQHIKLQLSQSDDQSNDSSPQFIRNHMRTMTQGSFENNMFTVEKSARLMQCIRKSQLESIQVSQPSKNDQMEYSLVQYVISAKDKKWTGETVSTFRTKQMSERQDKKWTGETVSTLRTKQMSERFQEMNSLQYQNSISVTPKSTKSPSVLGYHKSIRLGRRTVQKC